MELFQIYYFIKEILTPEDIFFLGLIILFLLEGKSDIFFIFMLIYIFISGLDQELLINIFRNNLVNLLGLLNHFV